MALKEPLVFYVRHKKAESFFNIDKVKIIKDKYEKLVNKYNWLISSKEININNTIREILFSSYVKLGLYELILSKREEAKRAFVKALQIKKSFVLYFLIYLSFMSPKFYIKLKEFFRNILIENIVYKLNMLRYNKFLKLYKSEIEEFINKAKLLQS